jgi:hypothetical protein
MHSVIDIEQLVKNEPGDNAFSFGAFGLAQEIETEPSNFERKAHLYG